MPQNLISLTLTEADHAAIADERRTLVAMSENPGLIPADVDLAEAQRDVAVRFTRRSRADKSPAPAA